MDKTTQLLGLKRLRHEDPTTKVRIHYTFNSTESNDVKFNHAGSYGGNNGGYYGSQTTAPTKKPFIPFTTTTKRPIGAHANLELQTGNNHGLGASAVVGVGTNNRPGNGIGAGVGIGKFKII